MPNFIKPLRFVSFLEGCSYLYLLFAAIVQKRMWGDAEAVAIPGVVHAILFVLFSILLCLVWIKKKWPIMKPVLLCFYSILPFGFILIDRDLQKEPEVR